MITITAQILLFLAISLNLVVQGGTSAFFILLTLLSLCLPIFHSSFRLDVRSAFRAYKWYFIGAAAFTVAVPLQQLVLQFWAPRHLDPLSRFFLALAPFLFLRKLPAKSLRIIGWASSVGATLIAAWAIYYTPPGVHWSDTNRFTTGFTNQIPLGDTALLLGFLAILTIGWEYKKTPLLYLARIFALSCGIYVLYITGTRGGWLAIPIFLSLTLWSFRIHTQRKLILSFLVGVIAMAAIASSTPMIQTRFADAISNLEMMRIGDADTSIGLRLELWKASSIIFLEHPVLGVGRGRLQPALSKLAAEKRVIPQAVNQHSHSDFFSIAAEMGIIGITCLGLLYFGMTYYFWRERQSDDPLIRTAAYSGLAVSTSTIIYGLTIDVLVPVMQTTLIALLIAALLAMIDARHRELSQESV